MRSQGEKSSNNQGSARSKVSNGKRQKEKEEREKKARHEKELKIQTILNYQKNNDVLHAIVLVLGVILTIIQLENINVCETIRYGGNELEFCDLKKANEMVQENEGNNIFNSYVSARLEINYGVNILRTLNTIFCFPIIFFVFMHYKYTLELMKERKQIYHKSKFVYYTFYPLYNYLKNPFS